MFRVTIRDVLWLMVVVALVANSDRRSTVSADEPPLKTQFGFDLASIPMRADGAGIVARCYQRQISLSEIKAQSVPLENNALANLRGIILADLLEHLAEKEKLQARPEEVERYYRIVSHTNLKTSVLRGNLEQNRKTKAGAMFIKRMKVSRRLYERYGGTVIFQQGNPLEPIDAYRQLLAEAEKAQVVEIYNPADRKAFWDNISSDDEDLVFIVPPDEVDFDETGWLLETTK